jgi:triacylglycerol lipase
MNIIASIIWGALVALLAIAFFYVSGSYLLLFYDRGLSRQRLLDPPFEQIAPPVTRWQGWKGYLYEVLATFLCILIYPFSALMRKRVGRKGHHPIVLVHGFQHNRTAWLYLRMRLRHAGFGPITSLNLRGHTIEAMAEQLGRELGDEEVTLIGHSMGGLVCAYYAEFLAPPHRVRRVITLGTPLQGTRLTAFLGSRLTQQMCVGSPFITHLERELRINSVTPYFHLASQRDNLIVPPQSAILRRYPDRERILPWQGHMTLLFSPTVARQLLDWLRPRDRNPQLHKSFAWHNANG